MGVAKSVGLTPAVIIKVWATAPLASTPVPFALKEDS